MMQTEQEPIAAIIEEVKAEKARQETRRAHWIGFIGGFAAGGVAVAAVFFLLLIPKTQALAASVRQLGETNKSLAAERDQYRAQLQNSNIGSVAELQKAVDDAEAFLEEKGIPNPMYDEREPLSRKAASQLLMLRVEVSGDKWALGASQAQTTALQNLNGALQVRVQQLAEQVWQQNLRQNQPVPQDDAIVGILNLLRPGLGTTLKKLHDAAVQPKGSQLN